MSAKVEWLVQELEEENSSLQSELKSIQDERDQLQGEVDEQSRLLKSCVEEVFSLKTELLQLMTSLGRPAAAERQQRLCERLARHVSEIEREVAEKGARDEQWRAEKERCEAALSEVQRQLEMQQKEGCRLTAELELARSDADKQAEENRSKIAELEDTVDCITQQKVIVEENHAREVEALKKTAKEAEESVRTACSSQEQLLASRREQERLSRQLATVRSRLAERDTRLADVVRSAEVKAAQVEGLRSTLHDSKARTTQLQKDLEEKSKQFETQASALSRKEEIIRRQKEKLESVANDLNKLKAVFSDSNLTGLCQCNEGALGGSMRDLRALRGGRPPPACPAKQLRVTIDQQKKQLEAAQVRTRELECSLDDIRQKLPQMSAEADRAYMELQAKLQQQQAAAVQAEAQQRDQQRRSQQLVLKLAAETRRLRDAEQLVQRVSEENRSLVVDRAQWERTSARLQAALHETVQLTARLQAARAELEAERRLTGQMRRTLDQADTHMKTQLSAVMSELSQLRRAADSQPALQVDWPRKYEELLDRCQEWQEECLARQKDCITMEQRLDMMTKQDVMREKLGEVGGGGADEAQLSRLERQLQDLLSAVGRVADPSCPGRPARGARSEPQMSPVASPRGTERRRQSGPADTSSGSIATADRLSRVVDPRPLTPVRDTSQSSLEVQGRRLPAYATDTRATPALQTAPPSADQVAPPSLRQVALLTGRSGQTSGGSVAVPELTPLLQRVTEIIAEVERQREQLVAQGHVLKEYRSQVGRRYADPPQPDQQPARSQQPPAPGPEDVLDEEEEPCRDGERSLAGGRRTDAGGDDGLTRPACTAQDAQTQSAGAGGVSVPPPASGQPPPPRRRRSSSARRDAPQDQLERLAHCRALQQMLTRMASPSGAPASHGCHTVFDTPVPDLSELRAQWRHLETMVRDETESVRTRSDVVLRLSGISESS